MPSTVILGGGIIGLSTAYYLAQLAREDGKDGSDHQIHVVESCPQLFSSASGKAGGFIAKDWFNPAMAPLGELSFDLHRQLATEHNGRARWGWSESISYSLDRNASLITESDEDTDDEEEGDLDSDPPMSPEPEPLPEVHPAAAPPAGVPSTLEANGADAPAGSRGNGSGAAHADEKREGGEPSDWMQGMSRVPVIEQRTADAIAAATAAAEAAEAMDAATKAAAVEAAAAAAAEEQAMLDIPFWLQTPPHAAQAISDQTTTGQINPHELCEFLLEQCLELGVQLHHPARAEKLFSADPADSKSQTMIKLNFYTTTKIGREMRTRSQDVPCDTLLLAAGTWTSDVFNSMFPTAHRAPVIQGLGGYSVVIRSKHWQPPNPTSLDAALHLCHAIFTSDPNGFSPELYARAGGDIWIGGVNSSSVPLPKHAMDFQMDPAAFEQILAVGRELCGEDIEVVEKNFCYRPIAPSGKPLIVRMKENELGNGVIPKGGVFLACGHGPWGISLCLGTGKVVSEMILGRQPSADVSLLNRW